MTQKSTLDLALDYLDFNPGRYLFPLRNQAKDPPLISNNLEAASNDVAVIREWHSRWFGCNWGLALAKSNLFVVDVDMKPGKNGAATWDDLDLQYGFPATETVRTPSGGLHHYYAGRHVFGLGKHGFGPDVDSPNYVLIPGCSINIGGNGRYETIYALHDNRLPGIQPAPSWFYDVLKAARERETVEQRAIITLDTADIVERAIHYLQNDARPSIEGRGGESQTLHTAGVLKDLGVSEPKCVELMAEFYNVPGICDPLWAVGEGPDSDRLDIKVRNAYAYLAGKAPGEDSAVADFDGDEPPPPLAMSPKAVREHAEREKLRAVADANPDRVWKLAEICKEWVYICDTERFVWHARPDIMWKPDQFSNAFAYLTPAKVPSLAKHLFTQTKRTVRKPVSLVYKPGHGVFVDDQYNLWTPSKIAPAASDTKFWNDHLAYLFPDEKIRGHVLDWLAWMLKFPDRKPKHALLIQGRVQGTGKSFIAEVLTEILGHRNVSPVAQAELHGAFNRWAMSAKLILVEELRALDKREVANKLHPLITQERIMINDKNTKTFPIDNCFGIFAMTNDDAAIPLDDTDRRYLVASTPAMPRDPAYYAKLYARLSDPAAVGAVAHELMHRDLKGYDAQQRAPYTEAKGLMIEASMSDIERYMVEHAGEYPFGGRIVTVADCIDALPTRLQRQSRIENQVGSILTHRFQGTRLGQHMVPSLKKRLSLWAINGTMLRGDLVGAMYDKDRENEHLAGATGAASDFGNAES